MLYYRKGHEGCGVKILHPHSCSLLLRVEKELGRAGVGLLPRRLTVPLLAVLSEDHHCLCGERNQDGAVRALGGPGLGKGEGPHITLGTGRYREDSGVYVK